MSSLSSFHTRRPILSLTLHLLRRITTTTNPKPNPTSRPLRRLSSNQTPRQNRLNNRLLPPLPNPTFDPPHKNPNSDPNFSQTDYNTISGLLTDSSLPPGPALEAALDRAGIELGPSLLEEIFARFDSSPKVLFTLFLWAGKQPGYQFSVGVFNSTINALGKMREFDLAWSLIFKRIKSDQGPYEFTFAILIRRYARAGLVLPAIRAYEYASKLDSICSSDMEMKLFEILLDSFCKEGSVRVASEYLEERVKLHPSWVPSTKVYNILLNGWFRSRKLKQAERLWIRMQQENVKTSVVTYGTLVEGYCRMGRVETAMELLSDMRKEGIEPNAIVYNPIIYALGEAGKLKEALGMMERLMVLESGPTLSTYNSLVKGFCNAGDLVGASKILKMMISKGFVPTLTTYNCFFRYFAKAGKIEEGLNLYTKLIESGHVPDCFTYHLLVKMLCKQERLGLVLQVMKEMRARGCDLDLVTCTMLIHLLLKMQKFDEACAEFEDLIRRGIVPQYLTYEKMSDELKKQGLGKLARKLCDMMASVPHSTKLPNTYGRKEAISREREASILRKAQVMTGIDAPDEVAKYTWSKRRYIAWKENLYIAKKAQVMPGIFRTCKNPRKLVRCRSTRENAVSGANLLIIGQEKSCWEV
ncbi:hypothetical protein RJ640_028687 [Escallonia rubra]|uniref:Pentatricopeptide repeat-containing protein n=1 Tax=Escallonia rubra TaxID=112253 RepID=A0AA88UCQ6_9ASTE|nr:hypothetical protein RJ640_028687 [Escallonia rubra]